MREFAGIAALACTAYAAVCTLTQWLMVAVGWLELRRQRRVPRSAARAAALASGRLAGVSILVPAYNEEAAVVETVRSALALTYPDFEVIVISDGSTDGTLRALRRAFLLEPERALRRSAIPTQNVRAAFRSRLDPRVRVLDKRNGGKADALNAGINYAERPLLLAIDADVVLDRNALIDLALPFTLDESVVATTGVLRPQNGCTVSPDGQITGGLPARLVERFQVLEYLRAYTWGRYVFNQLNAHLIISGALGLFSRAVLVSVGGYQVHAIGEDMELIVRLHRELRRAGRPYRVVFVADALALTQVPTTAADLGRQRTRWHQGLLTTLRVHRRMLFRPQFGAPGLIAMPYFVLELYAPVAELIGWAGLPLFWATGLLPGASIVPFLFVTVLLGTAVSLTAILLDTTAFHFHERLGDRLRLALLALVESVGYRQLTVFFRLRAFVRYYRTVHFGSMWRSPVRLKPSPSRADRAA